MIVRLARRTRPRLASHIAARKMQQGLRGFKIFHSARPLNDVRPLQRDRVKILAVTMSGSIQ